MNSNLKKELAITACKVRMGIIEGTHSAKSGHPGGSLSAADVLTYLYFCEMNVDPQHPDKADRDRLVLSKGHVAPALYAVLAHKGYFPVEELKTLRKIGSGHEEDSGRRYVLRLAGPGHLRGLRHGQGCQAAER